MKDTPISGKAIFFPSFLLQKTVLEGPFFCSFSLRMVVYALNYLGSVNGLDRETNQDKY